MQVGINIKFMHTNFGRHDLSYMYFGDFATFKNGQFSLSTHGLYIPWSSKNLIDQNRLKKFMQVGIDVKFMRTNFGERGFSGFRDIAFQNDSVNIFDNFFCAFFFRIILVHQLVVWSCC